MAERKVRDWFEKNSGYLIDLRRHFHKNPELAKKEFETAERICRELESFGLKTSRVGGTGVYSEIKGLKKGNGKERAIVLRADTDALPVAEEHDCSYSSSVPGVMHACGHDAHTASLLGAAKYLAGHRDLFRGTVRLVFQPGEEIGYGGRIFVKDGYLNGADRTFGVHCSSALPVGKVSLTPGPSNASVDWFRITVTGKSAHISTPEKGTDALYVISSIIVALHGIVTLKASPTEALLIGIGKMSAGTAYNIIADTAYAEGTIRAMSPESRAMAKKAVEDVSKGCASQLGANVSFEWNDNTSALINDAKATEEAQKTAAALIGAENIVTDRPFELSGDDFALFIDKVPGVYAYIGTSNPNIPETCVAHHNCRFDIDERSLAIAASLYAAYAMDFLNETAD